MNSVSTLSIAIASSNAPVATGSATPANDSSSPFAAILAPFDIAAAGAIRQPVAAPGNALPPVDFDLVISDEMFAPGSETVVPTGPNRAPRAFIPPSDTAATPPAPTPSSTAPTMPYRAPPTNDAGDLDRDSAQERDRDRDRDDHADETGNLIAGAPAVVPLPYPVLVSDSSVANPVALSSPSQGFASAAVPPGQRPVSLIEPQRPAPTVEQAITVATPRTGTPDLTPPVADETAPSPARPASFDSRLVHVTATSISPRVAAMPDSVLRAANSPTTTSGTSAPTAVIDHPSLSAPTFAPPEIVAKFATIPDRAAAIAASVPGQRDASRPVAPVVAPLRDAPVQTVSALFLSSPRPLAIGTAITLDVAPLSDREAVLAASLDNPSGTSVTPGRPAVTPHPSATSAATSGRVQDGPAATTLIVSSEAVPPDEPSRRRPAVAIVSPALFRPSPAVVEVGGLRPVTAVTPVAATSTPQPVPTPLVPATTTAVERVGPQPAVGIDVRVAPHQSAKAPTDSASLHAIDVAAPTLSRIASPARLAEAVSIAAALPSQPAILRAAARPTRTDATIGGDIAVAPIAQPHVVAPTTIVQNAPLDMGRHGWPQAMIERIEALRDAADAAYTSIRIVPDKLGTIDVSVRREGEVTHVHFSAEQAQTRTILADAQPRLAELADARGLRLGQSSIDAGTGQHQPQHQRPQAAFAPAAPARAPRREDAATTDHRIA